MEQQTILTVNDIHRDLPMGGRTLNILNGISFSVKKGEWIALTGSSGSGKSTLLGIMAGIDRPTSGSVVLNDLVISMLPETRLASSRNRLIGIVFQAFNLIPTMTALENVEAPLYIHPQWREAKTLAANMLLQVGLQDRMDHYPHQLSGGEQQRVALARALVTSPQVLFADEPTGNLDSVTTRQVLKTLQYLREKMNLTIVMVTHDPNVAAYADRRLKVLDGKIVEPEAANGWTNQTVGASA
ncbi:MAG: ABC transporter ATP-binding protein [Anaerolineaceae bacterium]|nr:ABC transporter ATP-binding protein [Anaerolineaceae bacterium]